jgi:hypothetical protein
MSETTIKEPTPQEKRAALLKTRQDAIDARAAELKTNVGKWFKPKIVDPRFPNRILKVISYDGIKNTTLSGLVHVFTVDSYNPRMSWTPPATALIEEHEPCDAPVETETQLPN